MYKRQYVPCEVCGGKRYNRETLDVKYKGKNIYDVLNMTVEEALKFFENVPSVTRKIQTLYDVGLDVYKRQSLYPGSASSMHLPWSWCRFSWYSCKREPGRLPPSLTLSLIHI